MSPADIAAIRGIIAANPPLAASMQEMRLLADMAGIAGHAALRAGLYCQAEHNRHLAAANLMLAIVGPPAEGSAIHEAPTSEPDPEGL